MPCRNITEINLLLWKDETRKCKVSFNERVSCRNIPEINLLLWKDETRKCKVIQREGALQEHPGN
jgi:hypothetical protein